MKLSKTRKLTESAVLIALASVLSLIKIIKMPVGGSVTLVSMLPLILIAYRHGLKWGLGAGLVYGGVQALFGLDNFSYVTGWQSVIAVLVLDYLLAFTVLGLGGIFRKAGRDAPVALGAGALFASLLRFLAHTLAGATVWEGLLFPTGAALISSAAYNAAYMVPETFFLTVVAIWFGCIFDLDGVTFTRANRMKKISVSSLVFGIAGTTLLAGGVLYGVLTFFYYLQTSGEYSFATLAEIPFALFLPIFVGTVAVGAVLLTLSRKKA